MVPGQHTWHPDNYLGPQDRQRSFRKPGRHGTSQTSALTGGSVGFYLTTVDGVLQAHNLVRNSRVLKHHKSKASGPARVSVVRDKGF